MFRRTLQQILRTPPCQIRRFRLFPLPLPGFPFTVENIKADRAVRYECDEKGTQLNFECLSAALCEMRADGDIGDEWKEDIEEYYDMNSEETDS